MDERAYHYIEVGEKETAYGTVIGGERFEPWSGTMLFGRESVKNMKPELFAAAVSAKLRRVWFQEMGPLRVRGGDDYARALSAHFQRVELARDDLF